MIKKLAKFDLEMVEQPVSAVAGVNALKMLKQSSPVALAADQSVFTPEEAYANVRQRGHQPPYCGSARNRRHSWLQKDCRNSLSCLTSIFACMVSGKLAITTCASIQAAATIPNLDDGNQLMWQLLEEDIVSKPDLQPQSGKIPVFSDPGLGFDLDQDAVCRAQEEYRKKIQIIRGNQVYP